MIEYVLNGIRDLFRRKLGSPLEVEIVSRVPIVETIDHTFYSVRFGVLLQITRRDLRADRARKYMALTLFPRIRVVKSMYSFSI